ncbi:MAG: cytochrome-c oxidase, cbb3-type subunit III [Alphaproteobacteria bacterium]|nr:MAG: cytochrome-c oxidase, cbb3-type subunit III [Alphaproteobacteria bacterium]TAF38763.1 MAG: cytochrome-c oxidase, cbb3-type subunit III [Alphaproteobacteria bacterium]TAF77609.1 MAG: cytochrome-c oxidase, cbb3-type subunit III [Alphaproteobacteria bacterium]
MAENKERDEVSGIDTTGHEWDGIKELNNPLPRWWLWVLYLTIIWAIGYWVVYPAFPIFSADAERGGTKGSLGWTQYSKLKQEQADIVAVRAKHLEHFHGSSYDAIRNDAALYAFALAGGEAAFKDNCATCHGTGGAGSKGYPNLNDDDWLWGGKIADIEQTIRYGVRMHDEARQSQMPAFAEMLKPEEVRDVATYVHHLYDGTASQEVFAQGRALYTEHCAACHGADGKGDQTQGAPNLADAIWLKNKDGSVEAIRAQIMYPKHGAMPAWQGRLDEDTIRQLSVYVHSLGGGVE